VVPDVQVAHAAAFLSDDGRRARASCKYHKRDWVRLVRILWETHDQANGNHLDPKTHPEYGQLSRNEQQWLHALAVDPIQWSDHSKILGGGQHRLCALRGSRCARSEVNSWQKPTTAPRWMPPITRATRSP
jgi:hypothetical protein